MRSGLDDQPWKGIREALFILANLAVFIWVTLKLAEVVTGWRGGWWE